MKFGEKLYEIRRKNGLSQEQLAEKLNVTRQTISKWELGQSKPDADKLFAISHALNVDINELTIFESKNNNNTYDPNDLKPRKWLLVVLVIVEILIVIVLVNKVVIDRKTNKEEASWGIFDVFKNIFNMENSVLSSFDTTKFNNQFSALYLGEEYGTAVKSLIDIIIDSNKTNKEHQVVVYYNNEILDDNALIKFKQSIGTWDEYDISYNYDDGYIISVNIELLVIDKTNVTFFNAQFEFYSGENTSSGLKNLINCVITSNHNNSDHLISVAYKTVNSTDENEIREITNSFTNFNNYKIVYYDVIIEYDEAGYVNQIIIKDK